MSERNFFAELKRRNVYKVAVAYAVVSWLLIQIATQVFPFFDIPNWAVRVVVLLLALGFPVALVLAWAFEITPEGIKLESEIAPNESITRRTGRKLVGLTIALGVIATGLLVFRFLSPKSTPVTVPAAMPAAAAPIVIPAKSIAVLPFENLSSDKDNAYFAEGIQDEILTRLSKIAALKVISRTSTQKYQSAPENLREIGQQLGVANLLEGSVQKIANAVHVNVQLIRAADDEHVWAESYNRKLDDVFAVEGEVASTIAEQLNAKLTGAEQKAIVDKPTQNVDAYNAYLRGLSIEHNEYDYQAYQRAAEAYAQAVQLDPKFALAWARLAVIRSFLYFNSVERQVNSPAAVQEAADRAMALAPEAGESWIARGAYLYRISRDFAGAVRAYEEAQKRLPNNAFVLQNLAFVQRRLGHWKEAEAEFHKALQLDPRDVPLLCSIGGEFYNYLRRFDAAKAVLDRALEIAPDSEEAHAYKAGLFQSEGRLAEAARELARVPDDSTDVYVVGARITQAMYERHFDRAISVIQRKISSVPPGEALDSYTELALVQLGFCQKWTGRHVEAEKSFARAIQGIKPTPDTIVAPEANGLPSTLALAYAGLGQKQQALEQAQQAVDDYATDAVQKPSALATLAQIQALFGDRDAAMAALPQLLQVPAGLTVADLKFNPMRDPLRKDPRFQQLLQQKRKMNPRYFFDELKRRNVVRMAGLYLVGAWLLVQVAGTLLPVFDAPPWVMKTLVGVLAAGLVPALIFSWVFELTPQGLKRDEDVSPAESIAPQTAQRMNRMIIAVLLFALGYFCVDKFVLTPRREAALVATASAPNEHKSAIPEKSIAVLPFENESGEKDEQYFSDGLSEDLITALSQFAGLKVIGRNSSFQFRDSKASSGTIGGKLGVAHLLEGSVRRAADVVRISAELVNATDGSTLWSQHYDRPYKDLFKVQDDITTAVASALKTRLLSADEAAARSDRPPSGSLEAYNAFLQAQFHRARSTKMELQEAIKFYQTAVSLDSHYALAYALMGNAQVFYGGYFSGAEAQKIFAMARTSIKAALSLNPDLAEAHTANALLLAFADLDWAGAKAEFERAVQLAPNDSDAVASLAQMNAAFGHPAAAIEPIRRTLADDPRNARWYALLSLDLMAVGRLDEAEQAIRQEIDVGGSDEGSSSRLCTIEVLRGNFAGALAKAEQLPPGKSRNFAIARARQIGNDPAAASAALQTLIAHYADTDAFHIAGVHALHGDPDDMFKWLERAWANREDAVCVVYYDPFVLRYKTDPRFAAFCRKVGLPTPAEVARDSKS